MVSRGPWSLYNGLASKLNLNDPPSGTFRLLAKVVSIKGHTTCAGSISISANGCTEDLEFTTTGQKISSKTFLTAKPTITVTDLDCTLILTAIDKNGNPIQQETEKTIYCRWDESSMRIQVDNTTWRLSTSQLMTASSLKVGDTIRKDDQDFEVLRVKASSKLSGRIFMNLVWLAG